MSKKVEVVHEFIPVEDRPAEEIQKPREVLAGIGIPEMLLSVGGSARFTAKGAGAFYFDR